jgi:cyclopropane-fatty-acyl-phospholipid synthase
LATSGDIQFHYDVDNEFYSLFLDREFRAYSCGVWNEAATLEDAQRDKIDRICRFARVAAGARLLDVGCGWGGLMERAVSVHGAQHAHGLTLSNDQYSYIAQRAGRNVTAALQSWDGHCPEQPYDAVVSVGAFEHFVSRAERLAGYQLDIYRNFFASCRRVSTAQAWLGLQTIVTARNPVTLQEARDARYLLDRVFPGSALPSESDIRVSLAGSYEVVDICRIGKDYARTLTCWRDRLQERRRLAIERFGAVVVDHYVRYFDSAIRSFESGVTDLVQASLSPMQTGAGLSVA